MPTKYSWVWKKSSLKNRQKTFEKITKLLEKINELIIYQGVKFEVRTEYAIEYMEQITTQYIQLADIHPEAVIRGRGHHKST